MDLPQAAAHTRTLWKKANPDMIWAPKQDSTGTSERHVQFLLEEIASGRIAEEKAHRWIGWAQGVLAAQGYLTLEQAKIVNVLS